MDLKTFLSVLLVYRSNFHVLHWMAKGKNFFKIHDKASEYYDKILNDVDVVAEMILRRSDSIVNYEEALEIIKNNEDHEFLMVSGNRTYESDDFKEYATKMFNDILTCIEELLETDYIKDLKNVGIKATLEGMHDKYDLEANYLLKRFAD